jgi:hypothetical protein
LETTMKKTAVGHRWHSVTCAAFFLSQGVVCIAAPGEDTIVLQGSVRYASMPGPGPATSGGLDQAGGIPPWMRARMQRYTAKAFSATADDGTIYTDNDVVTTVRAEGLRKTCVQEVASNTTASSDGPGTRYGPGKQDQVVVLRGDLVNICR